MRKNRCFKVTALLLAVMMFISMAPFAASADGQETFKVRAWTSAKELNSQFVSDESGIYEGENKVTLSETSDPNKSYVLKLTVAEPEIGEDDTGNPDINLPENTDKVRLSYKLPENVIAESGSNTVVSWTYDAQQNDIVFDWVNGKQSSFSADIAVVPNFPDRLGISGTYMLGTTGTGAALVAIPWMDGTREKLTSVRYSVEGGMAVPMTAEDPMWTLKHVTGDYYTIQASNGDYIAIKKDTQGLILQQVEESQAQKLLVKQSNGGYAFIYEGMALNNSKNSPDKGFASYAYTNGGINDTFKLFSASEIQHAATEDKSGTWAILHTNRKTILTAKTLDGGKLAAVAGDNTNSGMLPRDDVNFWTFTRVNRDWYTVSTDGGYLNIGTNGAFVSGTAQNLLLQNVNNSYVLSNGTNVDGVADAVNYSLTIADNGAAFGSVKYAKNNNTYITLKSTDEVIANSTDISGNWAITTSSSGGAVIGEPGETNKLASIRYDEYDDGEVASLEKDITLWTFTKVNGNWYTVKSPAGYLKISSGSVTLSAEESQVYIQEMNGKYRLTAGNQWALNNTGNNATRGYGSYDRGYAVDQGEWMTLRHVKTGIDNQLLFDLNGGKADSMPRAIVGEIDEKVILPDVQANKNGKVFVGWAETKSFYTANNGEKTCYHKLYKAGDSFTMRNGITTLYAVYDTTSHDVRFGIRLDGVIADEPNSYDTSKYGGHFWLYNVREADSWVIDINTQKAVNGYYVVNDVIAAVSEAPTAEQIAAALLEENKIDFDPETQYIHWYVMKYTTKEWHIDGVIREKGKVEVSYDLNIEDANEKIAVQNMPGSYQVVTGSGILIGTEKKSNEVKTPSREGYIFKGWNTAADGNGTSYNEGAYVKLTDNLHLYAQWKDAQEGQMIIKIVSDWPENKPAYAGTMITLETEITGGEDKDYTLQWQYTVDGENWENYKEGTEDGTGETMTYEVNEETASYIWRVIAINVKDKE